MLKVRLGTPAGPVSAIGDGFTIRAELPDTGAVILLVDKSDFDGVHPLFVEVIDDGL